MKYNYVTPDFKYFIDYKNKYVTITGYAGQDSCLAVPGRFGGVPVTSIGEGAFARCNSLTSVTLPDSVTTIGSSAFDRCTSLTSVTIGKSVRTIGGFAFAECTSLTSVSIPDSVTTIGGKAFSYCTNLTSAIIIGDNVGNIAPGAFEGCEQLKFGKLFWQHRRIWVDAGGSTFITIPYTLDSPVLLQCCFTLIHSKMLAVLSQKIRRIVELKIESDKAIVCL